MNQSHSPPPHFLTGTFIGNGDLALSVLMTTMTTVGAIVMTPLMGKLLLGQVVPVRIEIVCSASKCMPL